MGFGDESGLAKQDYPGFVAVMR